jgi:serine/threonine protein kinase
MTEESATRPSLVEGAPVCGAYVCGRLVRHDPWVSVYLARSAGGGDFNFEARVLHVEPRSDAAAASAFAREASRLQELRHAGIARIVAAAVEGGAPVVVTERVRGLSLQALTARGGHVDLAVMVRVVAALAGALDALHCASPAVVHRRLSPDLIVVDDEGDVWLEECGLAHALTRAGWLPEEVSTVRREYLSPDELRHLASPRSDVFALASIVFEGLTGTLPFKGDTDAALGAAIMLETRPAASAHRADLPRELDAVFYRAWSTDVTETLSAGAFSQAFESALEQAAQRIAREKSSRDEPAHLADPPGTTPLNGSRRARASSPPSDPHPVATITSRPPPLPRASTRIYGSGLNGARGSSASPHSRHAATESTPVKLAPAVQTLAPGPIAATDAAPVEDDADERVSVELPPPPPAVRSVEFSEDDSPDVTLRTRAIVRADARVTHSTRSRADSDAPSVPPRVRGALASRGFGPVARKGPRAMHPDTAKIIGVSIVAAAAILGGSQVYVARLSATAPPTAPSQYALLPVPEARPSPREMVPEVRTEAPVVAPPVAAPPIAAPPIAAPPVAVPPVAVPPVAVPLAARPVAALPLRPSPADQLRVRTQIESAVRRCVSGTSVGPIVQLAVTYNGRTGRASGVDISGRANHEPMGACIETAVFRWPFTPFGTPSWRVEYAFNVPTQ